MKKISLWLVFIAIAAVSCGPRSPRGAQGRVVTVTIPPFAWFVEQIGGDDFTVNVLLPPGADHHIWEPLPAQISSLSGSEAFIMNGQLGFEHAWMDRFRQVNPNMKVLDLSRHIELLGPRHPSGIGVSAPPGTEPQSEGLRSEGLRSEGAGHEEGDHEDHGHAHGGPDPHYWMSPSAALIMARDVHDFLVGLNPASSEKYDSNLSVVNRKISEVDSLVRVALGPGPHPTVMIYHPALAYMGRDYGFEQVSFEDEGKSPSPARMKQLIDLARENEIKIIFIQAEYDVRNAESLSRETGARLVVINPMNSDWPEAVMEIARAVGGKDFRF
jgi:zinc transport system substrate-binding protein